MRRASNIALACVLMGACGGEGAQGDASDATAPADVDTAAPADTTSPDGDTVDGDTATGPLATCDGPAAIHVEREAGDAPEVIAYANGDLAIRGYASRCGDDGDVDAFTLRGCLGPLSAWLTWAEGASTLDVRIAVPAQDGLVLDSAGEPAGHVLTADLTAPAGGGPLDVEVTVRCRAGEPTAWSLVLDTASTAPVPTADNGWPLDLYPADYAVCEDGRFPRIEGALDEYGATDVSLGQFYGDMLLVEVGGVWCYPCTLFARESAALHDEVEALSDAWGFSIVEVLLENIHQESPAATLDAAEWALAYRVSEPVLAGAQVSGPLADGGTCAPLRPSFPDFYIVDPLGGIRGTVAGYGGTEPLRQRVVAGWQAFIAENPGWVSPRCAGVAGEETLCPCADPAPRDEEPDADGDGVRDACDRCASGGDRLDLDRDGIPDACDDTPGYEGPDPVVITAIRVDGYFGYDGGATVMGYQSSGSSELPFIRLSIETENAGRCSIVRLLDGATTTAIPERYQTSGEASGPPRILMGWSTAGGSTFRETICDERLDLPLTGDALLEELSAIDWGVVVFDSCGVAGCERRDDELWRFWGCPDDPYCEEAMGAAVWFGDSGLITTKALETAGFVTAQPYSGPDSLVYDTLSSHLPLPALQPALPRAVYNLDVGVFPDELYERLLPNLSPPGE